MSQYALDKYHRALWAAVVQKAMEDALIEPRTKHDGLIKRNAQNWLTSSDSMFPDVCEALRLSPQYFREALSRLRQRPAAS